MLVGVTTAPPTGNAPKPGAGTGGAGAAAPTLSTPRIHAWSWQKNGYEPGGSELTPGAAAVEPGWTVPLSKLPSSAVSVCGATSEFVSCRPSPGAIDTT